MGTDAHNIYVTLGPASWSPKMLRAFLNEGVSLVRFPFAKETPEIHAEHHARLRQIADEIEAQVATLADLPGGKPRLTNDLPIAVTHTQTYAIRIDLRPVSRSQLCLKPTLMGHPLSVGTRAVIGDGENAFIIENIEQGVATGRFERKGTIERRRAFIPVTEEPCLRSFTDHDKECARAARDAGFDWVAISFVNSRKVLVDVRHWLTRELGWKPKLMAKVETAAGVRNAADICRDADAVLVGRGDLGLCVGSERLHEVQRSVIETCRRQKTWVAVGTGFVPSVAETGGSATSQEASDVRRTVEMGADALLLAAETTVGLNPLAAVRELTRIARQARAGGA